MNTKVKMVLAIGFLLIFFACVYAPWVEKFPKTGLLYFVGYSFFWETPTREQFTKVYKTAFIDLRRVFVEIIAIVALTGAGALLAWERKQ